MKRKTFKKALAGISAAAMLVSAMPMTLIADAYSYTNIDNSDDLFSSLALGINDDSGQSGGDLSYKTGRDFTTSLTIDLKGFCVADYSRYQINEVYATEDDGTTVNKIVKSAEYDWAAATSDIIASDPDFIKGVTFDQTGSPKRGDANFNAKFGTIKTITLSMPVNNAGVNAGAETTEYEDIEFTVVRDKDDIVKSFSNNALNEARHIILAGEGNQIDLTGDSVDESLKTQLSYTGDIDINLNGNTLKTKAGIQVSGKKMRIWGGGEISSAAASTDSTLAAYGSSSVIELYDNVTISNLNSSAAKSAISGEGTLIMCGDGVIVKHDGAGKAIGADSTGATGIATFVAGDYKYNEAATLFDLTNTNKAAFKSNGTTNTDTTVVVSGLQKFSTMKVHNYNKYGFEVVTRTGDIAGSTDYLDVDPKTPGDQYGYEPVKNIGGSAIILTGASQEVVATNVGQLFFLAQQINNGKFTTAVTAKLANTSFDFNNAPTGLTWTPIDASDIDLVIEGKFTGADTFEKYSVIKNMNVNVAAGDAGFVSNTKTNSTTSKISNLGFENSSVTGKGSVGTVVGFGDSVAIENVYVNNSAVKGTVKGGNYVGALAGTLYNSTINHTYSAADVQPVAIISGSTVTYLAKNGVKTTEGLTNFYDSGLVTPASGSSSATYIVGETSANFKNGTVAFKLNGHDPAQGGTTGITPEGFLSSSTEYNTKCSVDKNTTAPYNKDYKDDIFGQDLSTTGKGTSYPTFINITDTSTVSGQNLASNRVFREIVTQCTGDKEKWISTNANFLNTEADRNKSGHTDDNSDDICDTCKAYKISEKNFDKSLIPFLSQSTTTKYGYAPDKSTTPIVGDGWLNVGEINDINKVYIDLTTEDTSSLKVSDIVDAINAEDANGNAAPTLKGIDVLNQKGTTTLTAATYGEAQYVDEYVFIVNDAVLCRYVADAQNTDAPKKDGFLVATNAAATNTYAAVASGWSEFEGKTATSSSMQSVANATVADKNDFYVFADKDGSGSIPTAQFTYDTAHNAGSPKPVTFQIAFKGGVKHNDVEDIVDGSYSGKVKLVPATAGVSKHTYVGADCGCLIKTEECRAVATDIKPSTHTMKCDICQFNNEGNAQAHSFEIMFTIGNVTVKRCIGCGYVTAVKDTNITTGTPVLSLRKATDGATGAETTYWRQTYDFNITVGDGELVSYGVLYKKNPTASIGVDGTKLGKDASGKYFKNDGTLNTEELAADGANYTSKKGITTSGTYRVNVDMANSDEAVQIVGYVVYKAAVGGTVTVKVTDLTNYTFEDLAKAEMEACNFVTEAGKTTTNNLKPQFLFDYDLGENYTFVQYGLLVTRNADKPVTEKTVLADAVAYDKTLITSKICYTNRKVAASVKSVKYGANVSMAAGETATVRGYAVITDQYGLTWEIYSDVQSHTAN